MTWTVPATIRRAILAGEQPALVFPGDEPCPVEKGQQIGLVFLRSEVGPVPQVWITITRLRRSKKGEHIASYTVRDDRAVYLRPSHGHTRIRAESLDPDADIQDEETLSAYAAASRLRAAERRAATEAAAEVAKERKRALGRKLDAVLVGLEAQAQLGLLATIERDIREAQMGLEEAA